METLSTEQAEYAAGDVIYLHQIGEKLDGMLMREARVDIATQCFSFLPTQAKLDLTGFAGMIFLPLTLLAWEQNDNLKYYRHLISKIVSEMIYR